MIRKLVVMWSILVALLVAMPLGPIQSYAQPTNLVGYWNFDEGAGTTANDSSGHDNDGSVSGVTWTTSGKFNGALTFDGTNDSVQVPNSTSIASVTNRITIAAWVYPTSTTGEWRTLIQRDNANSSWFNWQIYTRASDAPTANRPVFRVDWNGNGNLEANEEVQGDITLSANTWYFITCTYDGTAMRFYIDGTLRGTTNYSGGTIPNSGNDIWIGGNEAWGEYFAGRIDEVRIYNTALTQAEIQALMNPGPYTLTVNTSGTGTIAKTPDQAQYPSGTVVQLAATPAAGWNFSGWSGDLSGTTSPANITMNGNKTVTATFTQQQYTLGVITVGSGTVVKTPNQAQYPSGTVVQLAATPAAGWTFAGWTGALTGTTSPASVTMDGNKTVTATFTQLPVAPTITTPPANQTVTAPQTATFTVVASGTAPLSYQWQKQPSGGSFANISGALSASYTTPATTAADNNAQFRCVVSNGIAPDATSSAATLTVNAAPVAPTITTPPANQTVTAPQTATFTVVASGTAPLSYQWQKQPSGGSFANISGALSASYTTPATTAADNNAQFRCVVSNGIAPDATSSAATLTVNAAPVAPTITTPPANQTVTAPQTATFTVVASGTAPLSYQWQKQPSGGSFANISGALSASYTTPATTAADNNAQFRCVVSNGIAPDATSSAATLTVNAAPVAPTITTPPANQTVTAPQTATFTVVASGTAPLSYQWQKQPSGGSFANISGALSASYTTPATTAADNNAQFRCVVSNGIAPDATSSAATLTVNAAPSNLKGYWALNETSGTAAADGSGNANTGTVSGATWNTSGKMGGALTFDGTNDSVQVPNSTSIASVTNRITIAAWVYPTSTTGEWRTLIQRDNANSSWFNWQIYTRASDAPTANRPVFRVDWNGNGNLEANEEVQGDITLSANTWYFITCTYDGTAMRFYIDGTLRGTTNYSGGTIPNSGNDIWIGGNEAWGEYFAGRIDEVRIYNTALTQAEIQALMNPGPYTLTVNTSGTGTIAKTPDQAQYPSGTVVQLAATPAAGWNFSGWSGDLSGTTSPANITMNGNKTVTATFTQQQYTLGVITVGSGTVVKTPNQAQYPSGTVVQLAATPAAGWTFAGWTGALTGTTSPASVTMDGNKTVTATFTQLPVAPTITTPPANQTVTAPQTATFTVVASGTAPLSYQWQKQPSGGSFANISGALSASYTTPATTAADNNAQFRCVVSNGIAPDATSSAATLTVNAAPVAPTITTPPANQTVTAPQTATFTVVASGTAPLSYQWQKQPSGGSFANISGALSASYTTPATTAADNNAQFRCVVSNGIAPDATSSAATLTVNAAPSNLKGYWALNETSGTAAADGSGNANTGTVSGATWNTSGKMGGALTFDGTNDSVQVPNSTSIASVTNRITIAAWVYPTSTTGEWRTLIQRDNANSSWFNWQIYTRASDAPTANRPVFRVDWNGNGNLEANEEVQGDITLSANTWYFITCTYDGTAMRFYIDGTLRGTTNYSGGTIPNSGNDIWIGGNEAWGEYFAGRIDEVRLYNAALTQAEIQALMSSGPPPSPMPSNCVTFDTGYTLGQVVGAHADWFDAGAGPVVTSGNGLAGSVGLASANDIFTWTSRPFNWNSSEVAGVNLQMDFQTDGSGDFDDDRIGWIITNTGVDSTNVFGIQLDTVEDGGIVTYWRDSAAVRVQTPIVPLTSADLVPNTWYRLNAKITKLTATSAKIDVSLVRLDASGNPTGTPYTGTVADTSTWSGGAPNTSYFTAATMWPAYKNFNGITGAADNACFNEIAGRFAFVVTTDWHTSGAQPTVEANLQQIKTWIDSPTTDMPAPKFMVVNGDFPNVSQSQTSVNNVLGSSFLWYPVIGNHEIDDGITNFNYIRDTMVPSLPYIVSYGPAGSTNTTYSWDYGNAHFVSLNGYWNGTTSTGADSAADGDIVPALRTWIDTELGASTQTHKFVFVHEPAYPANRHVGDSLDLHAANRDAFITTLTNRNVQTLFAGHTHYYENDTAAEFPLLGSMRQITNGTLQGSDGGATITYVLVDGPTTTYSVYHRAIGSPSFALRETFVGGTAPICYVLTLGHTGNGSDPVATPANSAGCSAGQYAAGATIQLSGAVPTAGNYVGGWTGTVNNSSTVSTNSVTMPAGDHSAGVVYTTVAPTCYTLTLGHTGNGSDPVVSPANSSGCSANSYVSGEVIQLSGASPSSGWYINGWTGTVNNSSTVATNTVNMPASSHYAGVTYVETPPSVLVCENFNAFTPGSTIGSHSGWYDGGAGPVVTAGNGVASSIGLAPDDAIFTWIAHGFNWNAADFQSITLQADFRTDGSGYFDDDRLGWMTSNSSIDSANQFGVQLDTVSGGDGGIVTYWRDSAGTRIQTPIVPLGALSANTWYRFAATITKLTSTSAKIDVNLVQLDASGNPTGTPYTGTVPNTSTWSGGAPATSYFTAASMWPSYKNHNASPGAAPADNTCYEVVGGTPGPTPTTVTFQNGLNGYAGTVDTHIMQSEAAASHGALDTMDWDTDDPSGQGLYNYALIRFDNIFGSGANQIPTGATIQSATLHYVVYEAGASANVNEIAIDWTEDATWNNFGAAAGVQAGDYGTARGTASGTSGAQTVDVTASLAAWVNNPTANRGWIFRPTGTDGVDLRSSEYATVANRPSLTVQYTTGTPGQYNLSVNAVGSGSVTLNPTGGFYDPNTIVQLIPVPATGWKFSSWSGDLTGTTNPGSITMNGNKTVTATFTQSQQPTNLVCETFDSYTPGSIIGTYPGWFSDPSGTYVGPVVTAVNGVSGSNGLAAGAGIFNWTAYPFNWNAPDFQKIILQGDFRTDGTGAFDDDRLGWTIDGSSSSSNNQFGVQLDHPNGGIVTYWSNVIGGSKINDVIVPLTAGTTGTPANTWYRFKTEITKLSSTSARIDVNLVQLDASGNPTGTPITGSIADTSALASGRTPAAGYFTPTAMYPSYKNYTSAAAPADNTCFEVVTSSVSHVIIVSVDGFNPDAMTNVPASSIPNLTDLYNGSSTLNARSAYSHTITLPNHASILTSRPITGTGGHGYTDNSDPAPAVTLHTNRGAYVAGVFDVAHDNGLFTSMYVSKSKFSLFDISWNATNGAPDLTGADNGRDKIDTFLYSTNAASLASGVIADLTASASSRSLIFVHDARPDDALHASGCGSSQYNDSIIAVDQSLGQIMNAIRNNPALNNRTAIILTADHGCSGTGHDDASDPENYTVPFMVWVGDGLPSKDLYAINVVSRINPGTTRPLDAPEPNQPIRNADAGNLALDLLGLPAIPNSLVNAGLDLEVLDDSGSPTFTIAGTVTSGGNPLANVVMNGLPGNPVTNASGVYSGTVGFNWNGTVTPTLAGYTFIPISTPYTNVQANQTAQNYTAATQTFTIAGTVTSGGNPLANVVMNGLPGNPVTNASGVYSGTVGFNWNGTVTPTLAGYTFIPISTPYTNVQANQTAQNYTAATQTFTVSGTVTSGGNPLANVVMNGLPGNPVTNASGVYSGTVGFNWNGTVTPTLAGYTFIPISTPYTNVQANQTAQNYTAATQTFTVSGTVTSGENPLANVVMNGLPGNPVTNASGVYSGTVGFNWNGTVTPTLAGYTFIPISTPYTNVQANQTAQNYTAATVQVNYALSFDGTNDYVTFGQATTELGVQTFTLEAWIKRATGGKSMSSGGSGLDGTSGRPLAFPVLTKGRGQADTPSNINMNFFLGITTTGVIGADFEDTATGLNHPVWGNMQVPIGEWHHIAVTYDGRIWRLYLDGTLDRTLDLMAAYTPEYRSIHYAALATALQSSSTPPSDSGFFSGIIDEARVWNIVRTQAEIQATMFQGITSGTGLLARWGLNEGPAGPTAGNSVAGGVNGTLTGGPLWVTDTFPPPPPPPTAPSSLTATETVGTQINLGWSDSSDNEASFEIERSTTGIGGLFSLLTTVGANSTGFSDSGLNSNSEYCYQVRAKNVAGYSVYSNVDCSTTPANPNNALDFGTGNAYVTFGNNSALGLAQFTLETWFKREGPGVTVSTGTGGIPNAIPIVTKGTSQGDGSNVDMNYFLGIDNLQNVIVADFEEGAAGASPGLNHPIYGATPINLNTWYHAVATYDGNKWQLFLNGNLERELIVGQPPRSDSIQHAAIATSIRSDGTTTQGYFDGVLDEARIWNYARTIGEIQSTINAQITTPQTGLVARWGLNEGTGTAVNGSAGTTVNGTITNTGYSWVVGAPFNIVINDRPEQPVLVQPADGMTGASISPTLEVTVSDPDSSSLNVTFYGRQAAGENFSVIVLPDTQFYSESYPSTFAAQTNWIVSNRDSRNVAYVSHVGDIVNVAGTGSQWTNADAAMDRLEDPLTTGLPYGIPYGLAPGNHDEPLTGNYNTYFGLSRFVGRSYYGGGYPADTNDNNYQLFSAGGMDFIVINLEYDTPAAGNLDWADALLKANINRRAIVVSHSIIAAANGAFSLWGQQVYDALKDNPNLFLMLCGHDAGENRRTDTFGENTIHTLLADYQSLANGGNGWLRILEFAPAANEIRVKTYSPTLNQWETDANSQFTLAYDMGGAGDYASLGTASVASGNNASFIWESLSPGTSYQWLVEVSDGSLTTSSPSWSFTTAGVAPPTCYALTLSRTGNGSVPSASPVSSAGCSAGQYVAGQAIALSGAVPDAGWQISGWTGTSNNSSTADTNSLIMPAGARSAGVNYTEIAPLPQPLPILVGDNWRYFKGTVEPPVNWKEIGFDDSGWLVGPSGFGYSDGDDATVLSDMQNGYLSVYARKAFTVVDPGAVTGLRFSIDYDDGFVAYLNGVEIARNNVTGNPPAYNTVAPADHEASSGDSSPQPVAYFDISSVSLVAGTNVLAVQGHNKSLTSSDFSLIPGLVEAAPPTCYALTLSRTGNGSVPLASPVSSTGCSAGQYVAGQAIALSGVVPDSGWQISGWTGTSNNSSTANTNSLTMPASSHAAGVNYEETPPVTLVCETFNSFTPGSRIGTYTGWYSDANGPLVTAVNGVVGSTGLGTGSAIFNWTAHPFNWNAADLQKVILQGDFQTNASGNFFDDDRLSWTTNGSNISSNNQFGVQLDPNGIVTYWSNVIGGSKVYDVIAPLTGIQGNTWYRFKAEITKLTATSARIDVNLVMLDGTGNPTGTPITGSIADTSALASGHTPAEGYFTPTTMCPSYKNHNAISGAADNVCYEVITVP